MAAQKKPKTIKVDINVDENGNFTYTEDHFQVDWKDTIKWKCKVKGHFAIHLGPQTPFDWKSKHSKVISLIEGTVKNLAPEKEYKYFVAIYDGNKLLTDDPIFIVRRH